jgi:hypothetical protein
MREQTHQHLQKVGRDEMGDLAEEITFQKIVGAVKIKREL